MQCDLCTIFRLHKADDRHGQTRYVMLKNKGYNVICGCPCTFLKGQEMLRSMYRAAVPDFSWSHATSGDKSDEGYSIVTIQVRRNRLAHLDSLGHSLKRLVQSKVSECLSNMCSDLQALNLHLGHRWYQTMLFRCLGGQAQLKLQHRLVWGLIQRDFSCRLQVIILGKHLNSPDEKR